MTQENRPTRATAFSLQAKIILLLASMLLVQGILSTISMQGLGQKYEKNHELTLTNARHAFGAIIAGLLFERYGDVQAFAANGIFTSKDVKAMESALDRYVELYGIYQGIMFVSADGKLVAANSKTPSGSLTKLNAVRSMNFADEPWFKAAIGENYTEDTSKGIKGSFVGQVGKDAVASALTGVEQYGIHYASPVKDSLGRIVGVMTTRSDFAWLEAEAKVAADRLAENGIQTTTLTLVDRDGIVLLDYDRQRPKEIPRDYNTLGKLNLTSLGLTDIKLSIAGTTGITEFKHPRMGVNVLAAYGPIKDAKFPESMGWSLITRAKSDEVLAVAKATMRAFYLTFAVVVTASLAIGFWITRLIAGRFSLVAGKLKSSAESVERVATELSSAAHSSAAAISQQAAAVQETVASMSEMSSMIAQTSQNVRESLTLTQDATEKTEEGNRIMQRLVGSMESIQQANGQLQNIGRVIAEITAKTGVINDIVFKTQLLSFNASIEAARAGQHGRGFAVVATEVGNLAQMSGNAAKEIQALLDDSRNQVQAILESTQHRVSEGQTVSADALSTFGEIARNISSISEKIRSINEATQEQELGVKQTSIAMVQMDEYAQRNNVVAGQVSAAASDLQKESQKLFRIIQASRVLVLGTAALRTSRAKSTDIVDFLIGNSFNESSPAEKPPNGEIAPSKKPSRSSSIANAALAGRRLQSNAKRRDTEGSLPVAPETPTSAVSDEAAEVSADDESFRAA